MVKEGIKALFIFTYLISSYVCYGEPIPSRTTTTVRSSANLPSNSCQISPCHNQNPLSIPFPDRFAVEFEPDEEPIGRHYPGKFFNVKKERLLYFAKAPPTNRNIRAVLEFSRTYLYLLFEVLLI